MLEKQEATHKFPALFGHLIEASDGFHENFIGNTRFRHPDCAEQVDPFAVYCLFECPALVGAKNT